MQFFVSVSLLLLIVALSMNLYLAFIVYKSEKDSLTNKIFVLLSIATSLWLVVMYLSINPNASEYSLFLIRLSAALAIPQVILFYLLAVTIPSTTLTIHKKSLGVLLGLGGLVMLLVLSPYVFKTVETIDQSPVPQVGPAIAIFSLFTISLSVLAIYTLLKKQRNSEGDMVQSLLYIRNGMLLMLGLIILTVLIPTMFFEINAFVQFVPIYTLIFLSFTAYAIVRHKLFNIRVVAAQGFTIAIWIVLFSRIFVSSNPSDLLINVIIFLAMVMFGILLMKSVKQEVIQREKLEDLNNRLQVMDKQKDEFISMAAHELRAPMTAIRGYVSMLLDGDAGELSDTARDYLSDANTVTERLVRLVNNMLNVGRIEEGRMVFKEEIVKVSEVINHVYISFKFEAQRKNLEFGVNIRDGVRDTVYVDVDKLNEVLGNLVSNAIKYTEKGRIDINLKQSNTDWVRVEIVDTGPGISTEEQKKLFQKFYRVESSVGKTIGTGLGLYICRLLVDKFGGKLGLESAPGRGSNFWFELPVVDESYKGPNNIEENKESVNIKV